MENLYEDKLPLQEPRGLSALLWLTGRFCCSAVVPYKFSLWKLSPSFCPSLSWQQIFISIKLSHSFASKLVDKLHSYKVTQDKLNGSKSHVTCDGDSRSRETCGHTEAPPLLPLLPPSLNFDLPCSWSPQDLVVLSVTDMRCCERQDESHVGLIKYSHSHTATHKVFPSLADVSLPTLAGSLILFLLFLFHGVIDTINERSQSLILPLCQMTPSAKLSKILQTNREKVLLLSCSLTSVLAVTVCKHTLTPSRLRSVLRVSKLVRVAIIHFYKGALHHTKKLKGDIWRWAPTVQEKLWVSLESLTNPHTWALSNSCERLQIKGNCKSHHYTFFGFKAALLCQTRLPCPLTSAAVWTHQHESFQASHLCKHALFQAHLSKRPLFPCLNLHHVNFRLHALHNIHWASDVIVYTRVI